MGRFSSSLVCLEWRYKLSKKGSILPAHSSQRFCNEAPLPTSQSSKLSYLSEVFRSGKKRPETDAIFAQVKQRNEEADADEHMLRISLDAKASVKIGPFARGGKSRVPPKAADHDFEAAGTVTPVGLFLPASDELFLYAVTCHPSRVTAWWIA
jgi:Rhodopirellula transposase DDE domain